MVSAMFAAGSPAKPSNSSWLGMGRFKNTRFPTAISAFLSVCTGWVLFCIHFSFLLFICQHLILQVNIFLHNKQHKNSRLWFFNHFQAGIHPIFLFFTVFQNIWS